MHPVPVYKSQRTLSDSFTSASRPATKANSPRRKPANRITGIITNVWHQPSPNVSSTSQRVYVVEIITPIGTSYLIRLRYITRDYRPLLGSRLSLSLSSHALKPTFELPNIPDAILAESPARVGASIFPERDKGHSFSILTPFNIVLDPSIFEVRMQKEEAEQKKQMTFQLFAEWIILRPKDVSVGYISAIVMKFKLVDLYKKAELFCAPCECGNIVFGNSRHGICRYCSSPEPGSGKTVALHINPQVLAEVSDETGGFTLGHNLLVGDKAWEKLLGRTAELFEAKLTAHGRTSSEADQVLRHWEQRLQYLRLTFVVGWSGSWGGGQMVVLDVLD